MSADIRELELKGVVRDVAMAIERITKAGAVRTFRGRLEDRRYDDGARSLTARDLVLRLRVHRSESSTHAQLDFKGPTSVVDGLKARDERSVGIDDPLVLSMILHDLGYSVIREIDRDIDQFDLNGTMIRFERYPRMDELVEVEGAPIGIDAAIAALGMTRAELNAGRLADFTRAFGERTGTRAAVSDRELSGDYTLSDS